MIDIIDTSYCVVCGEPTGKRTAKLCSRQCGEVLLARGMSAKELDFDLRCVVCGKRFRSHAWRRTCSEECSKLQQGSRADGVFIGPPDKHPALRFGKYAGSTTWMLFDNYGIGGDVPLPDEPTNALPGTEAKIEVLRKRAAAGQALTHPDDVTSPDDVIWYLI